MRLLAERTGLRAGLSAAMRRRGFDPVYDRGQVFLDLALMLILGGEAISDFQGPRHLAPVIGPVASTPTVWRALSEAGELQLARVNTAVTGFRRQWWEVLARRPEGFPWLRVAGRELAGITVVDLDASIVFAASGKENAQAGSGSARTWQPATTPMTCWRSTRVPVVRRPTARPTTSRCWAWRSPGCPGLTGGGCWYVWTGPGSPTTCSSTSRPAAGYEGVPGSSPSAGRAPTRRWTPSSGCPEAPRPPGSTRTAASQRGRVCQISGSVSLSVVTVRRVSSAGCGGGGE